MKDWMRSERDRYAPWLSDNNNDAWVKRESGGRQSAVSEKGARGIVQVMPDTFRGLQKQFPDAGLTDINDEQQNYRAGLLYLNKSHDYHKGNLVDTFQGYHGGIRGKGTGHWGKKTRAYGNALGGGVVAKYTESDPQMMASQEQVMNQYQDPNQDPNQQQEDPYQPSFLQSGLSGLAQMDTRGMYGAWVGAAGAGLAKGVQQYQKEMSRMRSNMSRKMGKTPIYMNVDGQTKLGVIDNEGNWHESKTPEGAQVLRPLNWMNMGDEWISAPREGVGGRPVPYQGNAVQPQGQPQGAPQQGVPQGPQVDQDGIDWNHPAMQNEQAESERYMIDPGPESRPEYKRRQEEEVIRGRTVADREAALPAMRYSLTTSQDEVENIVGVVDQVLGSTSDWNTGAAKWWNFLPETEAAAMRGKLETIGSMIVRSTIADLKAKGGTLGAISETELELLKNAFSDLSQDQEPEGMRSSMNTIRSIFVQNQRRRVEMYNDTNKDLKDFSPYKWDMKRVKKADPVPSWVAPEDRDEYMRWKK